MGWYEKLIPAKIRTEGKHEKKATVPEGLWVQCTGCDQILYRTQLEHNFNVCPKCDHHMRLTARERIASILDADSWVEIGEDIEPQDILKFKDEKRYKDRLLAAQKKTDEKDALVSVKGTLQGIPVVMAVFNFHFMGGSMGAVVGERFVQAVNVCLRDELPLLCFTASGGARMQEALFSLMQMAKTSAALGRMGRQGLPYITILTDPTMGGVSASLAMLGDIILAEPKALIGFAGPRVIEQTVREKLPEGFQRSEFLLEHGFVDQIVPRGEMRDTLARLLSKCLRRSTSA